MTTVTPAEIEKFRSQLADYPEAIAPYSHAKSSGLIRKRDSQ